VPTFTNNGGNSNGVVGTTTSHDADGVVGHNMDTTARGAAKPSGHGVFGGTLVPDGAGVFGVHAGFGIGAGGVGVIGVWGGSVNGVGVVGVSAPPGAKGGDGVQGITNSEMRNGIYGRNDSTTKGPDGSLAGNGVFGFSSVPSGSGVRGLSDASRGTGVTGTGVFGVTGIGSICGVRGISTGGNYAAQFHGLVDVTGNTRFNGEVKVYSVGECVHAETESQMMSAIAAYQKNAAADGAALYAKHDGGRTAAFFDGNVVVTGDIVLTNAADCAEEFDVTEAALNEPGMVMVLAADGRLQPCARAYDKRVLGVVSGAADYRPGIVLDKRPDLPGRAPIALVGKVFCMVDAGHGKVEVGDLLTTSPTLGHAMRAEPVAEAFGAIIGKALQPLDQGRKLIAVLVALQ
jgi:hypothetical protein